MSYHVAPSFEINSFTDSSLYQYYNNTNCLTILGDVIGKIVEDHKMDSVNHRRKQDKIAHLCQCYDVLLKNGFDSVVYDMINTSNQYDQFAICLVAINNDRLDIIKILAGLNFDFFQHITCFVNNSDSIYGNGLNNLLGYSLKLEKKIEIVKYLFSHGIQLDIENDFYLFYYINYNDHDFSLFDDFFSMHQQHSLAILIKIMNYGYSKIVERLLNIDTNLNLNMVKSNLVKSVTDNKVVYNNLNLYMIKLLINYGLIVDNDFFQDIFQNYNTDTIDYLMTEYHFVPDNDSIAKLFQDMDSNLHKIKLLTKHNVDLSNVKYLDSNDQKEIDQYCKMFEFINSLKRCNLDGDILTLCLLKKYHW